MRQPNQRSTAKSMKQFHNINRPSGVLVFMRDRTSQRDVLRRFLKIKIEVDEQSDRGTLFQREGAEE